MRKESKLALGVIGLSTLGTSYLLGQHGDAVAEIALAPASALTATQEPSAQATAEPAPAPQESSTPSTNATAEPAPSPEQTESIEPAPTATQEPQATEATSGVSGTFTSDAVRYKYGTIQLELVVSNNTISGINLIQATTEGRGYDQAPPILVQAALDANGSGFGNLSGATFTTQAFKKALDNALAKAGM